MPSSVNGCTSHVGEQDNNYDYIEMGNVTFNTITHSNQSFIHFFLNIFRLFSGKNSFCINRTILLPMKGMMRF